MIIMWRRKRKPVEVPDDTGEAQAIRLETETELHYLKLQSPEVESIRRRLARRREQNHFGEELSVTFRPREV